MCINYYECLKFSDWMKKARDRKIWSKRVEYYLNLPEGTYCRSNAVHQEAALKKYTE